MESLPGSLDENARHIGNRREKDRDVRRAISQGNRGAREEPENLPDSRKLVGLLWVSLIFKILTSSIVLSGFTSVLF